MELSVNPLGTWVVARNKDGKGGLKREEIVDILIAVQYKAVEKPPS